MKPAVALRLAVVVAIGAAAALQTGSARALVPPPGEPPPSGITRVDPALAGKAVPGTSKPSAAGPKAASFTPDTRVNTNAASFARPQVEPSVTSNPTSRNVQVAGYADSVADDVPGVSRSTDGGKTWVAPTGGSLLANPPGLIWGDRASAGHIASGDSAVTWSTANTVYFSTLGFQDNSNPPTTGVCNVGGLYVYRSTDGGNTWTLPAGGPAVPNTNTVFRDKEYIAADSNPSSPRAGYVYMVWDDDEYTGCPQNFSSNFSTRRIMFSRSADGGATWSPPATLASGCLVAAIPAVGVDGSVYVTWYDCNSGNREVVRKSADGGVTWSPVVAAGSGFQSCPNPLPGASFRVNGPFPTIATDPTSASRVFVAWSSCTPTSQADVFFSRSTDGGATWSPTPLRVNDDAANNPRDQFFPWITVDDTGVVRAMWGDDRLDLVNAGGHNYDIFEAASTDHGASFGPNVRVTTQSSNPDNDFGGTFIGDYFGMAPCGTPVWTDTRNISEDIYGSGLDADGNGAVDGCGPAVSAAVLDSVDFDGNHLTDIGALYRGRSPQDSLWYAPGTFSIYFGATSDIPVPGDYNGDGKTDAAIYRPATAPGNGLWYGPATGLAQIAIQMNLGNPGDIPIPGDYDGDGKTDPAIYRPSTGLFFAVLSGGGTKSSTFGGPNDVPVPRDYDGDGKTDFAIYRQDATSQHLGLWYAPLSGGGVYQIYFGAPGDKPVPGDYDGDKKAEAVIFRDTTGLWYGPKSSGGLFQLPLGQTGDIPIPGYYDNNLVMDPAIYRPSTGLWFALLSGGGTARVDGLGTPTDVPVQKRPTLAGGL
jgi:hypothetical protein